MIIVPIKLERPLKYISTGNTNTQQYTLKFYRKETIMFMISDISLSDLQFTLIANLSILAVPFSIISNISFFLVLNPPYDKFHI